MLRKCYDAISAIFNDPFNAFPWCIALTYLFIAICGLCMWKGLPQSGLVFGLMAGVCILAAIIAGGQVAIYSINEKDEDDVEETSAG